MAVIPTPFPKPSHVRSELFSRRKRRQRRRGPDMVTVAAIASSTREKLERARVASAKLAQFSTEEKNRLLLMMADAIEAHAAKILRANEQDIAESKLAGAMLDRLLLNPRRVRETAEAIRAVAALPDPVNEVLAEWTRP